MTNLEKAKEELFEKYQIHKILKGVPMRAIRSKQVNIEFWSWIENLIKQEREDAWKEGYRACEKSPHKVVGIPNKQIEKMLCLIKEARKEMREKYPDLFKEGKHE